MSLKARLHDTKLPSKCTAMWPTKTSFRGWFFFRWCKKTPIYLALRIIFTEEQNNFKWGILYRRLSSMKLKASTQWMSAIHCSSVNISSHYRGIQYLCPTGKHVQYLQVVWGKKKKRRQKINSFVFQIKNNSSRKSWRSTGQSSLSLTSMSYKNRRAKVLLENCTKKIKKIQ